ncbi:MAG: 30S ribosomal protein S19 [Candidatus Aenigmarchaeota archaeon]|nr:30S ribosomal protein S19 [Candidatus Aenigmarchaeota archaeon]
MAKIFLFHGKTVEDLKKMSLEEFSKMLTARQRRSLKKGLTKEQKKLLESLRKKQKIVKTHVREMVILPEMIDKKLAVYNGKDWVILEIIPEMLGHKLGEFSHTRGRIFHSSPGVGATKSSKFTALK